MHVGTTTVENLLRVARRDAAAGTAFAAFQAVGRSTQLIAVPETGSAEGLPHEELTELVRQASVDPEFLHARVFVRRVQLQRALTVAVAPLRDGSRDMIGVVAEPDRRFEPAQLEVLERLAERLVRHLHVVQHMNGRGGGEEPARSDDSSKERVGAADTSTDTSTGTSTERVVAAAADGPWWTVLAEPPSAEAPEGPSAGASEEPSPEGAATSTTAPVPRTLAPGAATEAAAGVEAERGAPSGDAEEEPETSDGPPSSATSPAESWAQPDRLTGLPSPGQFFSKAGRMLASDGGSTGAFVLVVVEVPDERTTATAARVLREGLRGSDSVSRLDRTLLAAALLVSPAGSGEMVERRLAAAVRSAVDRGDDVRTAYVVAEPGGRRDADELLREAVARLPGR